MLSLATVKSRFGCDLKMTNSQLLSFCTQGCYSLDNIHDELTDCVYSLLLCTRSYNGCHHSATRANLAKTMEKVCNDHDCITQKGVMLSLEDYQSMEETAYLLRSECKTFAGIHCRTGGRKRDGAGTLKNSLFPVKPGRITFTGKKPTNQ